MNTRLIMIASAIILAIAGVSLSFFPIEIANSCGLGSGRAGQLVIQILGALYFGFAMLNWMGKGSLIGGIYNKPLVIANLSHFAIGGLSLIKGFMNNSSQPFVIGTLAGVYTVFAILFGIIFSRHPANGATV